MNLLNKSLSHVEHVVCLKSMLGEFKHQSAVTELHQT